MDQIIFKKNKKLVAGCRK